MRKNDCRNRLLAAASKILRRGGYAKLTMERISAESGIAKTTLYRHWPTKSKLCMDLYLEAAARELRDPDTGDVARDLKEIARRVVRLQTRTVAGPAFIGLISEAHSDPETFAAFSARRRELTFGILKRAIERGELRRETNIDLVIDALGGAVTFRLLQRHAPLNNHFVDALVGLVLNGCKEGA
jgi:AcrR family transcriptional regulator